jgi:hypothetical protein
MGGKIYPMINYYLSPKKLSRAKKVAGIQKVGGI